MEVFEEVHNFYVHVLYRHGLAMNPKRLCFMSDFLHTHVISYLIHGLMPFGSESAGGSVSQIGRQASVETKSTRPHNDIWIYLGWCHKVLIRRYFRKPACMLPYRGINAILYNPRSTAYRRRLASPATTVYPQINANHSYFWKLCVWILIINYTLFGWHGAFLIAMLAHLAKNNGVHFVKGVCVHCTIGILRKLLSGDHIVVAVEDQLGLNKLWNYTVCLTVSFSSSDLQ